MAGHLCSIDDLSPDDRLAIFERAETHADRFQHNPTLENSVVACLFYEPSTRTHLSFDSAAKRLGMNTVGFSDPAHSSASKGETLEDTIRVVQSYADAIVLRHPESGAAARASTVANVPVINAGDGNNEHPTQTLLDMFTIRRRLGRLTGLRVGFAGDVLYGRTAHSLALAMAPDNEIAFIAPASLQATTDFVERVRDRGADVRQYGHLDEALESLDVLYMTRPQRERWPADAKGESIDVLDKAGLAKMSADAIVMHPLPRTEELPPECDSDPRMAYFEQVANGVPVRMAILEALLGQ